MLGVVGVGKAAHEAYTDPEKAGPDYAVQGEYAGEGKFGDETKKIGVQVVALGNHEFEATAYPGGLPGDGWSRGDKSHKGKGKTNGDVTEFTGDNGGQGTIKDGTLTIMDSNGNKLGELKKVERKSPTLGAKPPEGAIVLVRRLKHRRLAKRQDRRGQSALERHDDEAIVRRFYAARRIPLPVHAEGPRTGPRQ